MIPFAERLETVAELYRRATGHMAPGKSAPLETGEDPSSAENLARFETWLTTDGWRCAIDRIVELEAALERSGS